MPKSDRPKIIAVLVAIAALLCVAAVVPDPASNPASNPAWAGDDGVTGSSGGVASPTPRPVTEPTGTPEPTAKPSGTPAGTPAETPAGTPSAPVDEPAKEPTKPVATLPGGATKIFGDGRFLVAYYGSSQTPALGVLGENEPDRMHKRLERAARPFARRNQPVQVVYELIVTIADRHPGEDGDYAHDIPRKQVQKYIDAAHRNGALLILDIQPGRADFLTAVKRWAWALKDPYVGIALDPEWRMGKHGIPGARIGSVSAAEVNRVSAWLRDFIARHELPQKLFVLHQFRKDMIPDIEKIKPRYGMVMVQHVDGFGTPGQKLDTFHTVARPGKFFMGFKLFYDEDINMMNHAQVHRIRPKVRFISFQ